MWHAWGWHVLTQQSHCVCVCVCLWKEGQKACVFKDVCIYMKGCGVMCVLVWVCDHALSFMWAVGTENLSVFRKSWILLRCRSWGNCPTSDIVFMKSDSVLCWNLKLFASFLRQLSETIKRMNKSKLCCFDRVVPKAAALLCCTLRSKNANVNQDKCTFFH